MLESGVVPLFRCVWRVYSAVCDELSGTGGKLNALGKFHCSVRHVESTGRQGEDQEDLAC